MNKIVSELTIFALAVSAPIAPGQTREPSIGDRMITAYFAAETAKLASNSITRVPHLATWEDSRQQRREQLLEMLGLDPLPGKSDLHPHITGTVDHADFTVEKLHFQSMPGLYVTANLYLPKGAEGPSPAVLYLCGHGKVAIDGLSYGNKVHYQHHGEWLARNGYVCLMIDTLQLGEIEGLHHGTHHLGHWWWNSRGYTPAGVEAWNSIRAVDYLITRPEVDAEKIGVTGRSGGGAYSWYAAALDERIKVVVPVAGITDLTDHVTGGIVSGHCDCMYMVNTYRWDYGRLAAMIAPRPLLLANTDRDPIFPLDGVVRIHHELRHVYGLYGKPELLGLQISSGGHDDLQELQLAALRWFDVHLKRSSRPISTAAEKRFTPQQLKVFDKLPEDEKNTEIQQSFTPAAQAPEVPGAQTDWNKLRTGWLHALETKAFAGWPEKGEQISVTVGGSFACDDLQLLVYEFESQANVQLQLYLLGHKDLSMPSKTTLRILDQKDWENLLPVLRSNFAPAFQDTVALTGNAPANNNDGVSADDASAKLKALVTASDELVALVAPRGIGRTAWQQDDRQAQTHTRRKFMLLGQTLDGMRAWDVAQAIRLLKQVHRTSRSPIELQASGDMAVVALYASLFVEPISQLRLSRLPKSHMDGPDFLNVLRILDIPHAVAMAVENQPVVLEDASASDWQFARDVISACNWPADRLQIQADSREGQ